MSNINLKHHLNHLDRVIYFLDPIAETGPKFKCKFFTILNTVIRRILLQFAKLWNFCFGDHNWYSTKNAKKVLKHYLWHASPLERNSARTKKILKIYDHLALFSKKGKPVTHGLDRDLLLNLDMADKKSSLAKSSPAPLASLQQVKKLPQPTARMLFHLHANEFGENSSLEGMSQLEALKYLQSYFKNLIEQETKAPSNLYAIHEELGDAIAILSSSNFMLTALEKINLALTHGRRLLLPGGWAGSPTGHAVYYEIIPETETTSTLRIHNIGDGYEYQHVVIDDKVRAAPFADWKGISNERLFNPLFVKAVDEMRRHTHLPSDPSESTNYAPRDLYEGLSEFLKPKSMQNSDNPLGPNDIVMTPKSTGICAMTSLMPYLQTRLDAIEYKRFQTDIRLQTLVQKIKKNTPDKKISPWVEKRLIAKSHQQLAKKLDSLHDQNHLSDEALTNAKYKLAPVREWLKKAKTVEKPAAPQPIKMTYKKPKRTLPESFFTNPSMPLFKQWQKEPYVPPQSFSFFNSQKMAESLSTDPLKELNKINKTMQAAYEQKEPDSACYALTQIVSSINLDQPFWKSSVNTPEQARELLISLGQTTELFFKACYNVPQAHLIFPERIYILMKLLYLQDMLAKQAEPELWNGVGFSPKFLRSLFIERNLFFRFYDAKQQAEVKKIKEWFYSHHQAEIHDNYLYHKYDPLGQSTTIYFTPQPHQDGKKPFGEILQEASKNEYLKIASEEPGFLNLTPPQQQSSIFASTHLPKWLKALRNSHLYLAHMIDETILPVDPAANDINLSFKKNNFESSSSVTVALEGVQYKASEIPKAMLELRKDSKRRYAGLYRPMSSPHTSSFLNYLVDKLDQFKAPYGEKQLLSENAKQLGVTLPDEIFKELAHIPLSKELQISETLAFFIKHPQKLKDPDYQVFFQIFLFEFDLLNKETHIEGFSEKLQSFLQSNYDQFAAENEIQAAVFMLQMARYCQGFTPNLPLIGGSENGIKQLQLLRQRKGLTAEEQAVILSELAIQLAGRTTLQKAEIEDLIVMLAFLQQCPVPAKWDDPLSRKAIREMVHRHGYKMHLALYDGVFPNQKVLNRILKVLRPNEQPKEWKAIGNAKGFPTFYTEDNAHVFYPSESKFVSSGAPVYLPLEIRESPIFTSLYPKTEQAIRDQHDIYKFKNGSSEVMVAYNKDKIAIEENIKIGGQYEWCRFIPSYQLQSKNGAPCCLISNYILENMHIWKPVTDPFKLQAIDPKTKENKYRIEFVGETIKSVQRVSDGTFLGEPSNLLQDIEDPAYVHEWYSPDGTLREVELPRFGLSFTPNTTTKQLICNQIPGFAFKPGEKIPLLGSYQNYIVLADANGARKVFMPHNRFCKPEHAREVLEPRYGIKPQDANNIPYYIFDLKSDGSLANKSQTANMYLAQVLAMMQEYNASASYLKDWGDKLVPYSMTEKTILEDLEKIIEVTGDNSTNGIVLRTQASYLLLRNCQLTEGKKPPLNILNQHYHAYLQRNTKTACFVFDSEEESFIISELLQKQSSALLINRWKALHPEEAPPIPPTTKPVPAYEKQPLKLASLLALPIYHANPTPINEHRLLLTRPGKAMRERFLEFYRRAREGTPAQKEWIKASLPFLKCSTDSKNQALACFFSAVLEHPENFDKPVITEKNTVDVVWWKKTLQLAEPKTPYSPPIKPFHTVTVKEPTQISAPKPKSMELAPSIPTTLTPLSETFIKTNLIKETTKTTTPSTGLQQWLKDKQAAATDTQIQKKLGELQEDYTHTHKNEVPVYSIKEENLSAIQTGLQKEKAAAKESSILLQSELLALANTGSTSYLQKIKMKFKKWAGVKQKISLPEILLSYARHDPQLLLDKNPSLTKKSIELLYQKAGAFLAYSTRIQQTERSLTALQNLKTEKKPEKKVELSQILAEHIMAQHDPQKQPERPAILLFEYLADIRLRTDQVDMVNAFLENPESNLCMMMIMGGGKTSVLLPLLALLRADGQSLSSIMVPEALFTTIASETQGKLGNYFQQHLRTFSFTRNSDYSLTRLQQIQKDLEAIREKKDAVIITNKSVQCLMLKFIELYKQRFDPNKELPKELEVMSNILSLLGEKMYPVIDEADSILNILHEISFSFGKRVPVARSEFELGREIFQLLYTDPSLKMIARLDSDPKPNLAAPVLTEALYYSKLQQPLTHALLKRLKTATFTPQETTTKLHNFLNSQSETDEKLLFAYLCQDMTQVKAAQAYFDGLDPDLQDIFALASKELSHLLPHTLTRNYNEKYGLDGGILGMPYIAAINPSKGSQFAIRHITENYTFQAHLKKGISVETIKDEIDRLQGELMRELKEGAGTIKLTDTKTWQLFCKIRGDTNIPLFNCKPCHFEQLCQKVNESIETQAAFICDVLLPNLEIFEEKLSCNAHNLAAFFDKIIGFTGTLWNSASMHHTITPKPVSGMDMKTIELLWEMNCPVYEIKEGSTKNMLQQIKEQTNFDMLGDAGGYFKNGSNQQTAECIAQLYGMQTVFFDGDGSLAITKTGGKESFAQANVAETHRKTFLDQIHTSGANILQKDDAIGVVTISRNMLLRDLLQSPWRLRKLDKGQKVVFVISQEVKSIIRQTLGLAINETITFEHILLFTIHNQVKQVGKDIFKAMQQDLANIPQMLLFKLIQRKDLTQEQRAKILPCLTEHWIKPANAAPRHLYGQIAVEETKDKTVNSEKAKLTETINKLFADLPFLEEKGYIKQNYLDLIDTITTKLLPLLPDFLTAWEKDGDQTLEEEQQKQMAIETFLEVKEHLHAISTQLGHCPIQVFQKQPYTLDALLKHPKCLPTFPLKSYFEQSEYKDLAPAFDNIDFTINVLEWNENAHKLADFKLLGEHRTPFQNVLVEKNQVTILSQIEAILKKHHPGYYNMTHGFYSNKKHLSQENLERVVKVKFLNGESQFSKNETTVLKDWFAKHDKERLRQLYEHSVLPGYPNKLAQYTTSILHDLFNAPAA